MNENAVLELKYNLRLPETKNVKELEKNLYDFEKDFTELATKDEEASKVFKEDKFSLETYGKERFDGETAVITLIIKFVVDIGIDLTKDYIKDLIRNRLLPYLKGKFGPRVLEERE